MRKPIFVSLTLLAVLGCAASPQSDPKTSDSPAADATQAASNQIERDSAKGKAKDGSASEGSPTADWWKVAHPESDNSEPKQTRQIGRVAVSSDPQKHGDTLRLRFTVNGTPISGVFQAPGGKNSTFAIPSGTVTFTVDECEGEEQGFPLAAGEEIALMCKLTREGDCCEVAIPVEEATASKQEPASKRRETEK